MPRSSGVSFTAGGRRRARILAISYFRSGDRRIEVGYRSGHNGIASKAIGGSRPPRVQIPPPPLTRPFGARRALFGPDTRGYAFLPTIVVVVSSRSDRQDAKAAKRRDEGPPKAATLPGGDVREWTNRHAWRACDLARGPRVQIPSSPLPDSPGKLLGRRVLAPPLVVPFSFRNPIRLAPSARRDVDQPPPAGG